MRMLLTFALFFAAVFLTSCNTVEHRIERNWSTFQSFPEDVRKNIRQGRVDIGYTKEMVRIALGEPDRVYTRRTAEKKTEVWAYTERTVGSRMSIGFVLVPHVSSSGSVYYHHRTAFVDGTDYKEFERLRLEWKNNKVKAIEEVKRER